LSIELSSTNVDLFTQDASIVLVEVIGLIGNKQITPSGTKRIQYLGGNLGLFTGLSFVSIVELGFWLGVGLVRFLSKNNYNKKEMPTKALPSKFKKF